MRVFAVDPGVHTGVVKGLCVDGHFKLLDAWEFVFSAVELQKGVRSEEMGALGAFAYDWLCKGTKVGLSRLVIEDFSVYPGKNATGATAATGLSPVFVTGWLLGYLDHAGWSGGVVKQMASQAKGVITDQRLRDLGLWIPGSTHKRDACRHAELYCRTVGSGSGSGQKGVSARKRATEKHH